MTTSSFDTESFVQGAERASRIKPLLRTREPQPPALFLLYNLVRGRDLHRGFTPTRKPGVNAQLALRQAAERVPGAAQSLGLALSDAERALLTDLRRQLHLEAFEASCAPGSFDRPAIQGALWPAMRLTPHGTLSTGALGHGMDCAKRYRDMTYALRQGRRIEHAPRWLTLYGKELLALQRPMAEMQAYLINHDCGKAAVLRRDSKGRPHFPGHAEKSAQLWRAAGRPEPQAQLMELDMALHTLPVADMAEFSTHFLAPSLLLATQAQLFSNAATIFGGVESPSYRKKQAALDERARVLLTCWGLAD